MRSVAPGASETTAATAIPAAATSAAAMTVAAALVGVAASTTYCLIHKFKAQQGTLA